MTISWNQKALEELSPEGKEQMVALATQIVGEANRSASGHYYAFRFLSDGKTIKFFRGSKTAFLVEFGTRAIQGGRHFKRAIDRRRIG